MDKNKLTTAKRTAVVAALVEGNSVRSTVRMTNVSNPTILKLLADLGDACAAYHHARVRGLKSRRIQAGGHFSQHDLAPRPAKAVRLPSAAISRFV